MDNDQKGTCFMDKGTIFKFHNDLDTDQIIVIPVSASAEFG